MTMFPAHLPSLSTYGSSEARYTYYISLGAAGYPDLMAEDGSRTGTSEAGSSSRDVHEDEDQNRWLQLSLGGGHMLSTTGHDLHSPPHQVTMPPPHLIFQHPELWGPLTTHTTLPQPTISQQQQETYNYDHLPILRPFLANMMTTAPNLPLSSSSSGATEQLPGSHDSRQLQLHPRLSRMDLRVVSPPPRPHSAGVWFMLQASQSQAKEPFLPQIPKSYMRIKDGRMTVGLLIKYLVNKLHLRSESEVQLTCKGHELLSFWRLQYVRDNIWNNPRRNDTVLNIVTHQSSSAINYLVMVLKYGRI